MKKEGILPVLLGVSLVFLAAEAPAQDVELAGIWKGYTEVPDQGTDELTLVIQKEGDAYSATISDSLGMVPETECEDLTFEEGKLTFSFTVSSGYESMTVWITLEVEEDKMTGYWETEDGSQGAITLERQK